MIVESLKDAVMQTKSLEFPTFGQSNQEAIVTAFRWRGYRLAGYTSRQLSTCNEDRQRTPGHFGNDSVSREALQVLPADGALRRRWTACHHSVQVKWSKSPRVQPICRSADARSIALASALMALLKFP
jgi:hypothetical protein